MIEVKHLSKTFGSRFTRKNCVLNDVSFNLPDKGLVAIFGKSGSGKTTLLNIIGGLDLQDKGEVIIEGERITNKNRDNIRNKKIGFIFQNYYLEHGYSIGQIMHNSMKLAGFKDEEEIKRRTDEALRLVDLGKYQHKSGDALSGGQKQRVAIARALIKGTNIILADEPTGNLDAENTVKVMDILKEISKTRLVVLVTHETSLINRYADSHIELIDGVLQSDTTVLDVEGYKLASDKDMDVPMFLQSDTKHTGRLFNIKNIIYNLFHNDEERKGNAFKRLFLAFMAVFIAFFTFMLNEAITSNYEHKLVDSNSVYTNLNTYSELSMIDKSLYSSIDFFDLNQRDGVFSYSNVESIASLHESYCPRPIEKDKTFDNLYGKMPQSGEVLISSALANSLKHDLRMKELNSNEAILQLRFDNDYKIVGIIPSDENEVWFKKVDYVNFLGIYNNLKFVDNEHLFLSGSYSDMTYSATIALYEGTKPLGDNQIVVDIGRNSLYKMMSDTSTADYLAETANKKLVNKSTAIYVLNSQMYVKSFNITRKTMDTDIVIYITEEALNNIFVYLTPNIEVLGNDTKTTYYFEIKTEGGSQLEGLNARLKARGINGVDISAIYEKVAKEELSSSMQTVYMMLIGIVLILCIYYFIEMSESIKNSKEYGIYRAIGVNKSNLLFKEVIRVFIKNISIYFVIDLIADILFSIYYGVGNKAYGIFDLMCLATFLVSAILMVLISLIPYLFVITKTPSQIISRYDI